MRRLCWGFIAVLCAGILTAGEEPPQTEIPAEVRDFVRDNLKGCAVLSTRIELKTNAVLARLMADLYKSRYEYHFEMRDPRGDTFRVRMQDFSKIERLDDCKLRVADLPLAVQKRLTELGNGVRWDEYCEAKREDTRFIRYELKGRKDKNKFRAALLHDGTVITFPGVKDERVAPSSSLADPEPPQPDTPNANRKFIQ